MLLDSDRRFLVFRKINLFQQEAAMPAARTIRIRPLATRTLAAALIVAFCYAPVWGASLPHVAIVTTGGTIAQKTDPQTGGAVPAVSGDDLVKAVPGLKDLAEISVKEVCNIDSSQMSPEIWAKLSRAVDEELAKDDVAGVVVTHGTDTMAEGAYFLELTVTSDKPVVFTGAMNDASSPFPDGPGNIYNAVSQVVSPNAQGWGVTVTLNGYINGARAVRKTQTTNVQTFESGEQGYLGYIFNRTVTRFNERPTRIKLPLPDPEKLPHVVYISTYSGADGSLVRSAVASGAKGLVIDAFGAGNVNEATYDALLEAIANGVAVVVSSQVPHGSVEPVYADKGGGEQLLEHGAILAHYLDGHKARLLLMLGLAKHGNDTKALQALFK